MQQPYFNIRTYVLTVCGYGIKVLDTNVGFVPFVGFDLNMKLEKLACDTIFNLYDMEESETSFKASM